MNMCYHCLLHNIIDIVKHPFTISVLSAFLGFIATRMSYNYQYKKEYYKMIIAKRMDAYNNVETQVLVLKQMVVEKDDPYCHIFHEGISRYIEFRLNIMLAESKSLWITDDTLEALHKLNEKLINIERELIDSDHIHNQNIGRKYYKEISTLRNNLENCYRKDLPGLYKVEKFLKDKRMYGTRLYNLKQK